MRKKVVFLGILLIAITVHKLFAQSAYYGEIKGQVIDAKTLEPAPFCTIQIKEIDLGVVADENGIFHLKKVPEGKHNITISFVGYQEKTLTETRVVRNKVTFLNVELTESTFNLDDVEVLAYKYENISSMPTGTFSLSREEIFRSPASNGNIFKAISVIPGVQSGGGSFSALAVRGQGSEENAMFVDGFPVFELSHLSGGVGAGLSGGFDDPNGGRFSIFGPRVIDNLVIQTGGFSSIYGRKNSSFLGLEVKEGNPENAEMDVLGSITGGSINYAGPSIGEGNTLFTSFRYQNFVSVLNLTNQGDLGQPSFADLTIKSVNHLNRRNELTLLALYNPEWFKRTTENLVKDDELENVLMANASNSKGLLGVKLRTQINETSNWSNHLYYRFKESDVTFGKAYPDLSLAGTNPDANSISSRDKGRFDNIEEEIGVRSVHLLLLGKNTSLTSGIDFAHIFINHKRTRTELDTVYSFYRSELPADQQDQNFFVVSPDVFDATFKGRATNFSAYTNLEFIPFENVAVNAGVRYDYTGFSEQGSISPRLSLNYLITEKTSINASLGLFYQDPLFIQVADNSGRRLKPEQVTHYIAGVKHYFSPDIKFTIEGYYKNLSDLIVRPNSTINDLTNQGNGYAYGVDVSVVKRLSNGVNGQVNYSYSQSRRNNQDGIGTYDHLYSQPHIFNFLVSYQPNTSWIFSAKFRYSTGQPTNSSIIFSNVHEAVSIPPEPSNIVRFGQELIGRNDIRNDDFIGIDIRIDRRIQRNKFSLNPFIDIQNLTNRENASTRTFFETTGDYEPQALGILPTLGMRIEF